MSLWLLCALCRQTSSLSPCYSLSTRGLTKYPHLLYSLPSPLPTTPLADPSPVTSPVRLTATFPLCYKSSRAFQSPFLLALSLMCWGLIFYWNNKLIRIDQYWVRVRSGKGGRKDRSLEAVSAHLLPPSFFICLVPCCLICCLSRYRDTGK
jgi:hypothetical protein